MLSNSKLYPFLLFLLSILLSQSLSKIELNEVEPEQISINYSSSFSLNSLNSFNKYFVIIYSDTDLKDINYITISSLSEKYDNPGFIYTSFTEKNPSADNRQYLSQNLGKNEIIINTSKLKGNSKLYINIHSFKETEIKFNVSSSNDININLDFINYTNKKKFKLSDVTTVNMNLNKDENINYNKLMFYSIGEDISYFSMKVQYQEQNKNIIQEYTPLQKFENGYGVIIDINNLNNGYFEIIISPNENIPGIDSKEKEVEVGVEFAEESDNNIRDINIMEHVYGYITDKENCYKIKNLEENKDITLLLNTYTQAMSFVIYNNLKEKQYSMDVFDNYYIKINSNLTLNNYFCFKKFTRKEKEQEELGEISYDMQIYYDDDLINMQPYFYPLINGKIYTYSIKKDQIMLFRHSAFTKYNFLYSAVMNSLRGKPVLYGYTCETYPECNLDINEFNKIKNTDKIDIIQGINNYYINNKDYAVGDQEKNGEKMSESRKQYLSVVTCESSDDLPNNGECQFSIEINNYANEIQLIPEKIYANSILFDKNYFRIKISDYANISKLKIYFTIITGNADLNLYSDKNHQNIITNFNYRHAHRKEIFEFTKENILENYYIIITCQYPAFIEIKYETDFQYKGYVMTNPNEINIEYVNKKDYYTAYEMLNPDYFYPLTKPNNSDFYFTMNSLDCGITYRYDFNDINNVTSMHKEISKTSSYFGTSYGLMLKVDNYYHTTMDESEDCTVMIYTGEKTPNRPLLIIEDMFHPSEFKDTYYIFPFIINDDFDGVLIQFVFDVESVLLLDKKPDVNIVFKLPNQKDDFESYNINQDSSFFISKKKISKYCTNIMYQCSLIIEINKSEDEATSKYKILTNVHTSYNSVEYITKNKQYNYNLRSKDKKYFYTQIDKEEQGEINFIFNKGNGKIYAKLVEKNIVEKNSNWNRRINLPEPSSENLLPNDPLNNVIKYDSKNYNNCAQGCELYFLIESDEKAVEKKSLTEVSFSINKKYNSEESGITEINMNKYIKGTLEQNQNKYKYYTITIPYEYQKISINLYSIYGKAYIKLGKHNFCKEENKIWEIIPINGFGRIILEAKSDLIQNDTLKGLSFSIGITLNTETNIINEDEEKLFYYLEIQGLYKDDKPFYHITNERSIICDVGEEYYCNGIIYINNNYNNKRSLIYALADMGLTSFYVNIITKSDLDKKNYNESIDNLFPSKDKSEQKSENKNHIFIKSSNKKDDLYILVRVYSTKKNDRIKLISNAVDSTKTLLPYNTETIFDFYQDIKFHLPYDAQDINNNDYILNIETIKGRQNLELKDKSVISNLDGNYYFEILSYPSGKAFEIQNIYTSNDTNIDQGFLINIEKNKKNSNLFKLSKNIKNEIAFLLPQNSYIELNSPMKIEIYFHDISYNNTSTTDDTFKITGKILNSKNEVIYDSILGEYLFYEKTGIIKIPQDKIRTDDKYYLHINIDKATDNKNIYKSITVQYTINSLQEQEIIPNKFYYSSISDKNENDVYLINKKEENDKYIIIDFSEDIPVIDAFDIKKELQRINNDDTIKEIDFHGRKRFIIDLSNNVNYNSIKLNIKKNQNIDAKNYSLNYYSVKNLTELDDYQRFNDTLFVETNKENHDYTNLIFNTMMRYKRFFTVKEIIYYIDIFEKKDQVQSLSNIYSIYNGNGVNKNAIKSFVLNNKNINFFSSNVTLNLDIKKNDLTNKKYLIRVLADIFNNDGTREKFVYNGNLEDIDKNNKNNEYTDGTTAIIVCSVYLGVVTFAVLLTTFICIIIKKKNYRISNGTNEDSLIP